MHCSIWYFCFLAAEFFVDILADDGAIQTIQGTKYVTANTTITFHSQTDILISPNTAYTWHVIQTSSSAGVNITMYDTTLQYTFTKWGPYLLSVIGRTEQGATFVGQLVFIVECKYCTFLCSHNSVSFRTALDMD